MALFIVDYDLCIPGRNYDDLFAAIDAYPWAKICESSWVIRTDSTALQVVNYLKSYMDANDRLFVGELSGNSAWWNLPQDVTDWLKQNN